MRTNSTIIPKKRNLACGCYDYPFSKNRCKQHATIDSTKARVEKYEAEQSENNDEEESRKNLIEDLDAIVSRYTRLFYADNDGMVACYTCGTVKHFSRMQCGHFIPRANLATRWLFTNLRVQDEECNCHKSGNLEVFRDNLNKEHEGLADWLQEQARQIVHPGKFELKELLISYRQKLKIVEAKLKK